MHMHMRTGLSYVPSPPNSQFQKSNSHGPGMATHVRPTRSRRQARGRRIEWPQAHWAGPIRHWAWPTCSPVQFQRAPPIVERSPSGPAPWARQDINNNPQQGSWKGLIGQPSTAMQFAGLGLLFGLTLNRFMWIWAYHVHVLQFHVDLGRMDLSHQCKSQRNRCKKQCNR